MSKQPDIIALSYGGGLDSFACLVWAILTGARLDLVIFANVGNVDDDSVPGEWRGTLLHIDLVVRPLCEANGIEFVEVTGRDYPVRPTKANPAGYPSLAEYLIGERQFPGRTSKMCTSAAKVERINRYLDDRFDNGETIEMWIGFEANEADRAERARDPYARYAGERTTKRYPLIEQQLCRCRCEQLVRQAGLPVPRKSACVFCPAASRGDFATLKAEAPALFEQVQALEDGAKLTKKSGARLRYSGECGDATSPGWRLEDWVDGKRTNGKQSKPYAARIIPCEICGADNRATKATGCDWLDGDCDSGRAELGVELVTLKAENRALRSA